MYTAHALPSRVGVLPAVLQLYVCAGHDCGVYSVCFAEAVCEMKLKGAKEEDTLLTINPRKATEHRELMLTLILNLA